MLRLSSHPNYIMYTKYMSWQKKVIFGILGGIVLVLLLIIVVVKFGQKKEPVTVTYWGLWEPEEVMKPLISEFETAHPTIKINYVFQSQREYRERLQNALAAGRGPDVFRIHNTWLPMFRQELSPVPASVMSASEFEASYPPVMSYDFRLGGNYMAVPMMYDGLALYTNDELFNQGGKTVPTSWEELRKTAIELSVCDSADGRCTRGDKILISGASMGTTDNVDHWQDILGIIMMQNNVNLSSPQGQSAEESLQYFTIFNRADHIWDSTLPSSTSLFAAGKLAMYFAPSWRVFEIKNTNPKLKFSVHPLPQLPLDLSRGEKPTTWATYWAEGVSKKSKVSDAAWEWVKFVSSKDSLMKLYKTASGIREFGEIYPRTDMQASLVSAPYVGAIVSQADNARSWYLSGFTFDGPTGINSKISNYFADAINGINQGRQASEVTKTLSAGINQVLSQYGLATQIATPAN